MTKHKHKWRKVKKQNKDAWWCTWGLDGKYGNQCYERATHVCVTCDDDARCAKHAPKRRKSVQP